MRQILSPLDGIRSPFGRLMSSTAPFTPAVLFAASEPGVWLDPSDLTTLFQDPAGTTPVTTPGQTVALALDKSKGLVLGSELNGLNWSTPVAGISYADGVFTFDGVTITTNGIYSTLTPTASIVAGRTYRVSYRRTGGNGTQIRFNVGGTLGSSYSANGTFTELIVATTTAAPVFSGATNSTVRTGTVDNITIKELPGFHATQATTASRPIYGINPVGGRRNLLTFTEQFDNAAWLKFRGSITATNVTDPVGGTTADTFTASDTDANFRQVLTSATTSYAFSVWLRVPSGTLNTSIYLTTAVGVVATTNVSLTTSWQRFQVTGAFTAGGEVRAQVGGASTINSGQSINIWGAQLETGSTATAYQKVTTQYDVTEAGVASVSYLAFDTSKFLVTPTITPGIDRAQVFAGVRKNSDAAIGIVVESSADWFMNNGALALAAPNTVAANFGWNSRGSLSVIGTTANSFPAPTTQVLSGVSSISEDILRLRQNGSQTLNVTSDQGTGNYLAYPFYIGMRAGSSLPFNGQLYSLIVRFGTNLTTDTITSTETWVNGKTGAYA
jgi:hypothetical protein